MLSLLLQNCTVSGNDNYFLSHNQWKSSDTRRSKINLIGGGSCFVITTWNLSSPNSHKYNDNSYYRYSIIIFIIAVTSRRVLTHTSTRASISGKTCLVHVHLPVGFGKPSNNTEWFKNMLMFKDRNKREHIFFFTNVFKILNVQIIKNIIIKKKILQVLKIVLRIWY